MSNNEPIRHDAPDPPPASPWKRVEDAEEGLHLTLKHDNSVGAAWLQRQGDEVWASDRPTGSGWSLAGADLRIKLVAPVAIPSSLPDDFGFCPVCHGVEPLRRIEHGFTDCCGKLTHAMKRAEEYRAKLTERSIRWSLPWPIARKGGAKIAESL